MSDYIRREDAINVIKGIDSSFVKYIEQLPSADVVNREVVSQIQWERDTAISQLKDLGYGLGEKIRTDADTISRQAAIDAIEGHRGKPTVLEDDYDFGRREMLEACIDEIDALPSVEPEKVCIANITLSEDQLREAVEKVKEELKNSPILIEPERKKGKWIWHPEQTNIYGGKMVECSNCGTKYMVQYIEDELFCRNCGADMRSGSE